jgi:hypothetical protein
MHVPIARVRVRPQQPPRIRTATDRSLIAAMPRPSPLLQAACIALGLAAGCAAQPRAPRAADPYPSCSTGSTSLQFVGAGANSSGACNWAAEGDSYWFRQCIEQWTATVDR